MRLSDVMEDYLKAIYYLQRAGDGERVRTSAIADALGVTPPTVTSMLGKLDDRGLVAREKYRGVRLTEKGATVALEVIRHHRLLEAFLAERLDYDWSEVHEEADTLEHHISEELEQRIAAVLDDPDVDPHGDPIPSPNLEPLEDAPGSALAEYLEGETVVIERVVDREPDELRYLSKHGIEPGTSVEIVETTPFGMVTVQTETADGTVSLPESLAKGVRVVPTVTEQP